MKRASGWPILLIDVIGGGFVSACLVGAAWFTLFRTDSTADTLEQLYSRSRITRQGLSALRLERDRQREILRSRQAQLAESGELPRHAPVEEYFRTLSAIAKQHRLRVLSHNPLPSRTYPGLLERRYAYEVEGAAPDIQRFFVALEAEESWADIGFVKIVGDPAGSTRAERVASVTISVFSSPPPETEHES